MQMYNPELPIVPVDQYMAIYGSGNSSKYSKTGKPKLQKRRIKHAMKEK